MPKESLYLQPAALDLAWNDPQENLRRADAAVAARLKKAKNVPPEAQLFLFPELTLTGFVTENPTALSIDPPHAHVDALREIARRRRIGMVAGIPEPNPLDAKKPFNTSVLIGPDGKIIAKYRKMHLFTLGKASEAAGYSAGAAGTTAVYRGWKIGFAICFDIRFSALLLEYAKDEVDLMVVSSCWVGGPHKAYQYRTINSSHAILTQAYVAAVNRCGKDPFFSYEAAEYVFSPFGENIYRKKPAKLDPDVLEKGRSLIVRPGDRESYSVVDS